MTERTPKTLADAIEPRLFEQLGESPRGKIKISMSCESKDEATELARELAERGWITKVAFGMVLPGESKEWQAADLVCVTGRSKARAS